MAEAHVAALAKAPALGFDTFIISALTPFSRDDCEELIADAPAVVARLFPRYREIYARLGWTMFDSIDRIYDFARPPGFWALAAGRGLRRGWTSWSFQAAVSRASPVAFAPGHPMPVDSRAI